MKNLIPTTENNIIEEYKRYMEINCRNEEEPPKCLDLICISNIFDSEYEVVFRLGNKYRMYAIDDTMLVYDDNWIPYIFTIWEYDWRENSYLS